MSRAGPAPRSRLDERNVAPLLDDLLTVAPAERRAVLQDQLDRLDALIDLRVDDQRDIEMGSRLDRQGIGVAAGAASSPQRDATS